MRARFSGLFPSLTATLCASCATVINGPTERLEVLSTPPGALVTLEPGEHRGVTPAEFKLDRDGLAYSVTLELEGYETRTEDIYPETSAAVWGNILSGGLIGYTIDRSTGAIYTLYPNPVDVILTPVGATLARDTGRVVFFNTCNSILYADETGHIQVRADGRFLGKVRLGEWLEVEIPVGKRRITVDH